MGDNAISEIGNEKVPPAPGDACFPPFIPASSALSPPYSATPPISRVPSTASSVPSSRKRSRVEEVPGILGNPPQMLSAQAALQALPPMSDFGSSVVSSKQSKKSKEPSTSSVLVGMQGSLSYLGTIITSSSPVAAQQRRSDQKQHAYRILQERDNGLPLLVKSALLEAFRIDSENTIELYITLADDEDLRRQWVKDCLKHLHLIPKDYEF